MIQPGDSPDDVGGLLVVAHRAKVVVGGQPERGQRVIEKLRMLTRGGEERLELAVSLAERPDDGEHLDRLRTGPHDAEGEPAPP